MGATKTEQFTEAQNHLAVMAKALGHPARIAIIEYLAKTKGCVCGEIVDEIGLAQATISQHLKALKEVGIVRGKVEGVSVCYCLDEDNIKMLGDSLTQFIKSGTCGPDCC